MPTPARINGSAAAVRIGLSAGHSGLGRPRPSRARTPHGRVFLQPVVTGRGGFQLELGQFVYVVLILTAVTTIASWAQYFVLWIWTRGTMEKRRDQ